jgi:hypothetical protein
MVFDTKVYNIILVIFQIKVNFQQFLFLFNTLLFIWTSWNHMSQTILIVIEMYNAT